MNRTPLALGLAALLLSASPRVARAASAEDSAAAQSLYDQAKKLIAASKWADACPKLEESQRLDPTQVTEFYLADCFEHVGRTASAWSTFLDLAATARKANRADREKSARDRATALEAKLTRLSVEVPPAVRVAGLVVKRDGAVLGEGQWGTPVAVDPGQHTVEASAAGRKPWSATQDVSGAGQTASIQVPPLAELPAEIASAPPSPPPSKSAEPLPDQPVGPSPLKTIGLVTGGVGIVGLGVGVAFGALALSKNSQANNSYCGSAGGFPGQPNECTKPGIDLRSTAVSDGNLSTIFIVAGGVLAAGGVAMFLLAPSAHVQVAPAAGANGGGLLVRGDF